jgi:hypothetical protein
MSRIWAAGACFLCFSLPRAALADAGAAPPSQAEIPATSQGNTFSAALLAGYGFAHRSEFEWRDDLGVAYGVRAGNTYHTTRLYLGGTLLRYQRSSGDVDSSSGALDVELGYELPVSALAIRPYLGVGGALFVSDGPDGGSSAIGGHLAAGLLAKYRIGIFEAGADARYERASSLINHFSILGSLGVAL